MADRAAEIQAKADIKAAIDLAELVREHGVELRQEGRDLVGLCPFHEEHTPSFKIRVGGQHFKCFGCDAGGDVFTFVQKAEAIPFKEALVRLAARARVELPRPSKNGRVPARRAKPKRSPEVQALIRGPFEYRSRAGEVLYTITRTDRRDGGKTFSVEPKDYPAEDRVIYRLPELEASKDPVILPEGEGKADLLASLGYTATATPFGSRSWRAQYAEPLRGRHVILWPDNDDAGRAYIEAAASDLITVVASLRVVEPPEWLPEGDDVVDVLEDRGEAEVRRLVEVAPLWDLSEGLVQAEPPPAERRTVAMCDVVPTEPRWLSQPRIQLGTQTLMFGAGGDGKTFACCAIMAALSRGKGLWGAEGTETPSTCIYFTGEDSLEMLRRRLDLLDADAGFIRGYSEPFGFDDEGFAFVEREIEKHGAELCVIDPVVAFLGRDLDMYRANETRSILAPLNKVAERTDAAIILVTHVTKGAANRAMSRALGSADFVNAARSALLVGSDPDEPRRKALCHVKCNNGPLADPVGFEIDEAGRFLWSQSTDLTAARILGAEAGEDERQAGTLAEELLFNACKDWAKAVEVIDQAKSEEISKRTLQRVAGRMCERRREGFGKGSAVYWKLKPEYTDATGAI